MDKETTTIETQETPVLAGDNPAPTEAAPAELPAEPLPVKPASRVVTIPTAKMGAIKKEEREKGRIETRRQYDDVAKSLGYDSHEQLMSLLQEQSANRDSSRREVEPADDHVVEPVPASELPSDDSTLRRSRKVQKLSKDREQLMENQRKLSRQRADAERQKEAFQEKLDAQQAEHELRFAAMQAGIASSDDVDYAVNRLRRELKGKTADELKNFDPAVYFGTDLRKSMPYIYGEKTRGATSSPTPQEIGSNGGAPAPARTDQTSGGNDANAPIDARTLDDVAYAALLRSRGLTHPSVGMPI